MLPIESAPILQSTISVATCVGVTVFVLAARAISFMDPSIVQSSIKTLVPSKSILNLRLFYNRQFLLHLMLV